MAEAKKGMYKFDIVKARGEYGLCGSCNHASYREYDGTQEVLCGAPLGLNRNDMPAPTRRVIECSRFWQRRPEQEPVPPWMTAEALYMVMVKPKKFGDKLTVGLVSAEEFSELDVKDRVVGFK